MASEGLQYWLPYRSFSWIDASLNTLGILFGYAIFATVRPLRDLFFRTFRSSS